jgi:ABC-type sugar transport system ATPase subunit
MVLMTALTKFSLSALDAKLCVQMRLEIKKLHDNLKITSVYVTHDQVEAMTLGHRLLVMNGGNVEQLGRPLELYEKPMTTFVAGFIGSPSMNLMTAQLDRNDHSVELPNGERIPCHGCGEATERPVILGIRPEHWQVVEAQESVV